MTGVSAEWLAARLAEPARALGAALPPSAIEPLAAYANLVLEWGARVNLTGARDAESVADDHLADALALLGQLPGGAFRFIDVGSGAGFPGIVVALLAVPQATHYVLDGFIWRSGPANPDVRRLVLGLSLDSSETPATPRARTARAHESPSRGPSREAACS
jgi:16S rRNA (guanine527-N7)-methyltransferase